MKGKKKTNKPPFFNKDKTWCQVLDEWSRGVGSVCNFPMSGRFQWNTSVAKWEGSVFRQECKLDASLPKVQDFTPFVKHIDESKDPEATAFPNISGDTMLVVPMPKEGKNFATLWDFMQNASSRQQQAFWKRVAKETRRQMKLHGKVWVSTHGQGVAYLHVRICTHPKYYLSQAMAKSEFSPPQNPLRITSRFGSPRKSLKKSAKRSPRRSPRKSLKKSAKRSPRRPPRRSLKKSAKRS